MTNDELQFHRPKTQHRCLMAGNPAKRPTTDTGRAIGVNALFLDMVFFGYFLLPKQKKVTEKNIEINSNV